jgi:anaerobic magnesium-protoporphyrin IX monomethyl ester cyclase
MLSMGYHNNTMKVILVTPGAVGAHGIHLEDKFTFPVENLGLGYLAAALQTQGIEVEIIDGYAQRLGWEQVAHSILATADRNCLVGISVLQATAKAAKLTAQAVQKALRIPIVLGGWLATTAPRELMHYIPEADYLLRGEAELTLPELVNCLRNNERLDHIPGLVARGAGDEIVVGPPPSWPKVEELPYPVHYLPASTQTNTPLPIQGSRGCRWGHCTFCSTAGHYGRHWRYRAAPMLVAEMQHLYEKRSATSLCFVDDSFFGPCPEGFQRAHDLVSLLQEAKLPVQFAIDCRVGDVRPDLFAQLQAVGLRQVFVGIEAGHNATLRRFGKGFTVEQSQQTLDQLRQLGLRVITGYIGFDPYMTLEEVRANIAFLRQAIQHQGNPAKYLRRLVPYHGTAIWKRLKTDGLLVGEFPEWDFRFQDARVEALYHKLYQLSEPLREAYLKNKLYQAHTEEMRRHCQRINESFLWANQLNIG